VFSPGSEELHKVGNSKDRGRKYGDREEESLVKEKAEGRA
jgi:hypothetical protein